MRGQFPYGEARTTLIFLVGCVSPEVAPALSSLPSVETVVVSTLRRRLGAISEAAAGSIDAKVVTTRAAMTVFTAFVRSVAVLRD
jgi:hypothetical protein